MLMQHFQDEAFIDSRINFFSPVITKGRAMEEALFLTPFRQPLQVTSGLDSGMSHRNHEEKM
jgi:hypothetical protein